MAKYQRPTNREIEEAIHDALALARESEREGDSTQARVSNDYAEALQSREEQAMKALAKCNYEWRQEERKSSKAGN